MKSGSHEGYVIGKTKSLRDRFNGSHQAFLWAWLDKYNDEAPIAVWEGERGSIAVWEGERGSIAVWEGERGSIACYD